MQHTLGPPVISRKLTFDAEENNLGC